MKKRIFGMIIVILLLTPHCVSFAHSGRTDSSGGHNDNKNKSGLGSYHYHCGGNPAHLHKNGICPYSSSKTTSTSDAKQKEPQIIYASSIKFTNVPDSLNIGETTKIECSVIPSNAVNKDIRFKSSNQNAATISETGVLTALAVGTATITATTTNEKSSSFTVKINEIKAESITIDNKLSDMFVGETVLLKVTINPDNTTDKNIIWETSDSKIARIDLNGNLEALSPGEINVSVTQKDVSNSFVLTVKPVLPESVMILPLPNKIKVGDSLLLDATILPENATDKAVTWTVDSENAVISDNKLIAQKKGEVSITATTQNGKNTSFKLDISSNTQNKYVPILVVLGSFSGLGFYLYKRKK